MPARLELDRVARDHPRVRDVDDPAALDLEAVTGVARAQQAHLLRPDREALPVALEHVRRADEAGDERCCGGLVAFMLAFAAGCGSDDDGDDSGGASADDALQEIGEGEGELNLVIWAGYAEDGS